MKGPYSLTKAQARHFLLLKQGLLGDYRFSGKQGVLQYVRQAGCIQYDPIDICGKNAALVLQARVKGFSKQMLGALLYTDRRLLDYTDKNMSIFCTDNWKYFARCRRRHYQHGRSRDKVEAVADAVKCAVKARTFACAKDLALVEKVDWAWSPTTLARAALETLYQRGELVVHHKKGTIKYYALAEDCIDGADLHAADPNKTREAFMQWRVLRRIGSIGLLWNRASDAWLGIDGLKREERDRAFRALLADGQIFECSVEGTKDKLYGRGSDEPLLRRVREKPSFRGRMELLAPLDNLLWDRKLVRAIFGFDYKWEIYTPAAQRRYGYYVLPVLYGSRFAGRIECVADKSDGRLHVRNFWREDALKYEAGLDKPLGACLCRFAQFNGCEGVCVEEKARESIF